LKRKREGRLALLFLSLLGLLLTACFAPTGSPTPQGSEAPGCWSEGALPPLEGTVILNGIHAFSEREVWAVGQRTLTSGERTFSLVMRWDGEAWREVEVPKGPDAPRAKSPLYSVGGTGTNDVWAVGAVAEDGAHYRGLALHWDGSSWTRHETPNPGALDNTISSVSAAGPDNVWAVGSYLADEHEEAKMLAIRWDGTAWREADLRHVDTHVLLAVSAPAPGQAWAAGTEVLRWDGARWVVEPVPEQIVGTFFDGVAASPNGTMAWAVGNDGNEAVAAFWNGARWSGETLPKLAGGPYPHDLTVLSPIEVWSVGEYSESSLDRQLMLHRWDGARWSAITNPVPGRNTRLLSATRAGYELWAAGAHGTDAESKGLVLRYSSCK
jgi:hypothetical protein